MVNAQSKPFYLNDEQKAWVQKMLHSMSTEEKVGQLFCVMGQDYTPEQLQSMAADGKIGGILFRPEPAQRIRMRYLANYEQASNQTTVRIDWCKKHALDGPRFLNEEPCVFVSLANPYLLQDVPRVKTYINAYTATRTVIGKLMTGGSFTGVSPVDAFCGLPDTRI